MKKFILILGIVICFLDCFSQETGAFTDPRDGKVYKTIKIGTQTWMAENLQYKTSGGIWEYDLDDSIAKIYGRLYNWNTAKSVCPTGWHLPGDDEWTTLINYLGGDKVASGKLKEAGTAHWKAPNTNATNESGFTALPGGYRFNYRFDVTFESLGSVCYFWSSTRSDASSAWSRRLSNIGIDCGRGGDGEQHGFSVRCLKD
jgi:uncharacterized protein (TIGR02145 family)